MKRKSAIAVLLSLTAVVSCLGQQQKPKSEYAVLLAHVRGGDTSIDFKQLRFAWMDSPERHQAKDTSDEAREMFQALSGKDYKKAVEKADIVLASEFVDMNAQFVEFIAYRELQDSKRSDFHKAVFDGLLRSITDSADGKSLKTAYVVISVDEEYVVLRVLGLTPSQQSVVHDDGHSYDVLEAKDPKANQTVRLYFNVDIPFKHYLD